MDWLVPCPELPGDELAFALAALVGLLVSRERIRVNVSELNFQLRGLARSWRRRRPDRLGIGGKRGTLALRRQRLPVPAGEDISQDILKMIVKMADQGQTRGPDGRRQRVPDVRGNVLSDCQADQGLIGAPGDVREHGDCRKIVLLPFQYRTDRTS
jgi:hypothetical protein